MRKEELIELKKQDLVKNTIFSFEKLKQVQSLKKFINEYESMIGDKHFKKYYMDFLDSVQLFREADVAGAIYKFNEFEKDSEDGTKKN